MKASACRNASPTRHMPSQSWWRVGDAMRWSSLRPPASTTSSFARRCVRPTSASPGSILPGLATLPVPAANSPRPTRSTRGCSPPSRAPCGPPPSRSLRLPATPWRDWQNGGISWSSCELRRRTVAVKPGTAPWSNASAASSKSSITRSPRSRLPAHRCALRRARDTRTQISPGKRRGRRPRLQPGSNAACSLLPEPLASYNRIRTNRIGLMGGAHG